MAFRVKLSFSSAALALATLFCGATPTVAQTAASVRVPDEPSCTTCVVAVRTLVTLGTGDGAGSLTGPPNAVRMDARGRYWVLVESARSMPRVFRA
jgi:hypothetical protein